MKLEADRCSNYRCLGAANARVHTLRPIADTWYGLYAPSDNTCSAEATFIDGVGLFLSPYADGTWNFQISHDNWSFEDGRHYDVSLSIDGKPFVGGVRGV